MSTLTATAQSPRSVRVYRGDLWVGTVFQKPSGHWATALNSTGTSHSRAPFETAQAAAAARWNAATGRAVAAALT